MAWNQKPPYCSKCGSHHYFSEPCAEQDEVARENQPGVVVGAPRDRAGGAVGGSNPPAPELAPEVESPSLATTPSDRTARWREKNRERYNAYMREYRKRKK